MPADSARERALRAAEAAVRRSDPDEALRILQDLPPETREARKGFLSHAVPIANAATGAGDITRIGKRLVVVVSIEWRDPTWAVTYYYLSDKGRRVASDAARVTYVRPMDFPTKTGRWIGRIAPGEAGSVESVRPSSTIPQDQTTRPKEDTMASTTTTKKVVKRGGAKKATTKAASAKAKTNGGGSSKRSHEDLLKLVPEIVKLRKAGKNWDEVATKTGVTAIPARKLLAESGYDNKGESKTVEKITATGKALVTRLVKERQNGTAWYTLALATGKSEAELQKLVGEAGGPTGRVYAKSETAAATSDAPAKATGKGKAVKRSKGNPSKTA